MSRACLALLKRDLLLAGRIGGSGGLAVLFFLLVVAVVPFGLGPDLALLSRVGPAFLWIGALLATLVGLDRLFQADEEDGSLDLLRLSPAPLEALVLTKALAHWLVTGLPLSLAAPLLAPLLAAPAEGLPRLVLSLLVGTPALSFVGAVGAALTASLRRGGLILAILVLPFSVPALIFGVAAASPSAETARPALLMLAAFTLASAAIGTIAAAAALRSAE